jgi:hypothetical protein
LNFPALFLSLLPSFTFFTLFVCLFACAGDSLMAATNDLAILPAAADGITSVVYGDTSHLLVSSWDAVCTAIEGGREREMCL